MDGIFLYFSDIVSTFQVQVSPLLNKPEFDIERIMKFVLRRAPGYYQQFAVEKNVKVDENTVFRLRQKNCGEFRMSDCT